jgi:hypothetical protein
MRTMKWPVSISCFLIVWTAAAFPQERELTRVMREKLDHAQRILGAVVTSDWPALERQSRDLLRVAENPTWVSEFRTPMYARHSEAFLRATQDLLDAAQRRDLEVAPIAYVSLTLTCVQCHRYTARARVANNEAGGTPRDVRKEDGHDNGNSH